MRPVVEIMTINFRAAGPGFHRQRGSKIPFMSGGQFPMPLVVRAPSGIARQLVDGI